MASDGNVLLGLWFDGQNHFGNTIATQASLHVELPVFDATRQWLDAYFAGTIPQAMPPLMFRGTAFQQHVWAELLTVPYGQTVTYGELARRLGVHSAQAVGGAVGRNPISIIVPCHRVVGSDGSLTGYAGGLDRKRALLQLEQKISFFKR